MYEKKLDSDWVYCRLFISTFSGLIGYNFLTGSQQNGQPWMFIGAYATYEGKIDSFSMPYNLSATIEVTNLNFTHVQIRTNSTIATSFAPALSDQTIRWVNKTNINFQHKGETLARTYSIQITADSIGARYCSVYDYYVNESINATYYLDNTYLWPPRIIYVTDFENQPYTLEFNLKDTNIIELF
jgi:hypothetical protein